MPGPSLRLSHTAVAQRPNRRLTGQSEGRRPVRGVLLTRFLAVVRMIPGDRVIVRAPAGAPISPADDPGARPQARPVGRRYTPARSSERAGAAYQSFFATTFGDAGSAR